MGISIMKQSEGVTIKGRHVAEVVINCKFCGQSVDLLSATVGPSAGGTPLIAHDAHRIKQRTAWLLFCAAYSGGDSEKMVGGNG